MPNSNQFQSIFRLHQQICPLECSTPMKRLETREVISLARQKRRGSRFYREYSRTTTSSIMLLVVDKSSISPTPPPCDCFRFIPRSCSLLSLEPWTMIRSVNRLGWFISMDVPLPVVDGINKNQ